MYDDLIRQAVSTHLPAEYDWRLFKAQLYQESRFKPDAISPAGAVGIAQIMPKTWPKWSAKAGFKGYEMTDPEASIFTGACYLAWLIDEWSWPRPAIDRYCLAMASYNAGLGNILKAQKQSGDKLLYRDIMPHLHKVTGAKNAAETIGYSKNILNFWTAYVRG